MQGYDILKKLSFDSAQETYYMSDFEAEVDERLKDLDLISCKFQDCLLIGATAPEMIAWYRKFDIKPTGIALDEQGDPASQYILLNEGMVINNMDMHDLEFPDNSFDMVYASQVLEHSPAPIIVLIQIFRVLKEGGFAFLWIPDNLENQKELYHYSCFPREIWENLLIKSGFCIRRIMRRFNSWAYEVSKDVKVVETNEVSSDIYSSIDEIFYAKKESAEEIINDKNEEIVS